VILAASVVVWALSYWPRHPDPGAQARATLESARAENERVLAERAIERARQEQAVEAAAYSPVLRDAAEKAFAAFEADEAARRAEREEGLATLEDEADRAAAGEALRHSVLGRMGRVVEPVFAPIGWDWKVSMAVLASFPAREVVVSTLGVIYNLGAEEDEESTALKDRLRDARWESGPRAGEPVFDVPAAIALMVFFALCAQCLSTLVIIGREAGGWRWAAFTFAYMTALAYVAAIGVSAALRAWLPASALTWWS
jgi:ferrous iron transport protein B